MVPSRTSQVYILHEDCIQCGAERISNTRNEEIRVTIMNVRFARLSKLIAYIYENSWAESYLQLYRYVLTNMKNLDR